MNKLRCLLFAATVLISSATLALGGDIQGPGKSDPLPTRTPTALTTTSTGGDLTKPTWAEEIQDACQDTTATLVELLLIIF
jgi:hypothetical protein